MKTRHRVVWTQGMFLTPQHFQSLENYFEDSLHFRQVASSFANWGVTELKIDTDNLPNGTFSIDKCVGIMPDGESINVPDSDAQPPSRTIGDHFPPSKQFLDVYLAIPESRIRARNVTIPGPNRNGVAAGLPETRYLAETRMIADENAGEEEKAIQIAQRTFRILFGDEYRDGYSNLRVAQLVRNRAGEPMLNPEFVAPCLNLASSRYLKSLLRRQIGILVNKSSTLSGLRRQRGKVAEFSASDTSHFWLLHTVNSFLPELNHIWRVRQGHPESAYLAMLRLAGALATFSLEGHPENLPEYDHQDLGRCFTQLDAEILQLMEAVIPEKFISVPLEVSDRFLWTGKVSQDEHLRNSQCYLAVSAKMGVDDLIRKTPQLLKVSSADEVQRLVRNSLPGLSLRHTPAPPEPIRMRLDNQYFLLNQGGPLWDAIVRSRQIAVFAPGEIMEPKMELVIVLDDSRLP